MSSIRLFLMGLLLLGTVPMMASCATVPGMNEAPLQQTLADEKGLYVAEAAFSGVSLAVETAVDAGVLRGANAAQVKVYYDAAKGYLDKARVAQSLGNKTTVAELVPLVLGEITKIWPLVKGVK